ncbi:hypothetical protein B0F90DRAFT_1639687, partial [Multifurca ochricompacta]
MDSQSDNDLPFIQPSQQSQNSAPINRRFRPAPTKTFQCRGYGDCRMVFSRSEHLARHIRKHTGERPFTCHCGKQFSRLDNLRQHAQTVHADKQEANERMMRELSSLHATMAAANKATQQRVKRGAQQPPPSSVSLLAVDTISASLGAVKQEDIQPTLSPVSQRPGTSVGYEGDTDLLNNHHHHHHSSTASRTWYSQHADRSHPRHVNNHSFRDQGQSFRAPPATSPSPPSSSIAPPTATPSSPPSTHLPHPGQSFL